jgi:hypothetical protein
MNERHREFLISLGADKTPHSGRVLLDHLKGVHDLLRDWDNSDDVCAAGLFHSIYGTEAFKHQSLEDRNKLIEVIGEYAEGLVWLFSVAKDRPMFRSIENPLTRIQLMEIEAANLLEQGGGKKSLRKLARMRSLSNGAKAALNSGAV